MHTKSYQEHLRDAKYCGLQWRLLFLKPDENESNREPLPKYKVIRQRCNSKACPHCAKIRFNRIRQRFKQESITTQWRFFTLTSINSDDTSHAKLERLETHFRELRKKLKRQYPELKYIKVIELSPSGMWHIHGLWNIYIDIKLLSKYWTEISGAYRCYVEKVRKPKGALNYIFKYCFKSVFNDDERRIIYETDKRKFTTSRGLLTKNKIDNPYTCEPTISYDIEQLKQELYKIISSGDDTINDFYSTEYPYFEDLIYNLFYQHYNKGTPQLFNDLEYEFA